MEDARVFKPETSGVKDYGIYCRAPAEDVVKYVTAANTAVHALLTRIQYAKQWLLFSRDQRVSNVPALFRTAGGGGVSLFLANTRSRPFLLLVHAHLSSRCRAGHVV